MQKLFRRVLVLTCAVAALGAAAPLAPFSLSQAPPDRLDRIARRVDADTASNAFDSGEKPLVLAELAAARHAVTAKQSDAPALLDALERQLSAYDRVLTRSNDGSALVVRTGQDVTVAMNDPYFYDLHLSDPKLLVLHAGVMFTRGIQGIYRAAAPGIVTITLEPRAGTQPQPPPALAAPMTFTIVILPRQATPQR